MKNYFLIFIENVLDLICYSLLINITYTGTKKVVTEDFIRENEQSFIIVKN